MQHARRAAPHYLEAELREMLGGPKTLELLDECILDGLWYWDLENPEQEYMSPGFWETLGFEPENMKHLASEWMDLIFPEDGELAQAAAEQHFKNPVYPYDQIVRYKTKSGAPITIRCRGSAILQNGKPVRLFGAHTVVSDKKITEIQKRVDLMMRLSNDAIVSWTDETGVQTWNKGAESCYGIKEAEAIGKQPFELSAADLPEPWHKIRTHLETGEDWVGEILHTVRSDLKIYTATRISSQVLDDGRRLFLKISRDETRRIEAEKQNSILLRELKHRVRNLFAVVQSITRLTGRNATDVDSFSKALQHRIGAISAAHTNGIAEDRLETTDLLDLVQNVLSPYLDINLRIEGRSADVEIEDDQLTPLSLLINEVATNAVKYGAWSMHDGRVDVKWERVEHNGQDHLLFEWTETLPQTAKPLSENAFTQKPGFGSLLIENSTKQLGGTLKRELKGHKLCFSLTFPI